MNYINSYKEKKLRSHIFKGEAQEYGCGDGEGDEFGDGVGFGIGDGCELGYGRGDGIGYADMTHDLKESKVTGMSLVA